MSDVEPTIKRTDNQEIVEHEEPEVFQKISIQVKSVCYYDDPDMKSPGLRRLSAILLNVSFLLPENNSETLLSARIRLVARESTDPSAVEPLGTASSSSHKSPSVEIIGSYPPMDEYVRMSNGTGDGPIVAVSPQRRKLSGPATLSWIFQGNKRVIYPRNIKLLVIVSGPGDPLTQDSGSNSVEPFPFRLCVQDLQLEVLRRIRTSLYTRLRPYTYSDARDTLAQGRWYFDIAPYRPKLAEAALEDAKNGKGNVGLFAALSAENAE